MKNLINSITNKNYDDANAIIEEAFKDIMEKKLWERRKAVGAKMCEQPMTRAKKLAMDVLESDDSGDVYGTKAGKKAPPSGVSPDYKTPDSPAKMPSPAPLPPTRKKEPTNDSDIEAIKKDLAKEEVTLDEARIGIIKARIRGGKVQRRKKVSNVAGYRLQGNKLTRMSAAERRKRKLGARKAKIKRRSKMARALVKRKRSLRRRASLGV